MHGIRRFSAVLAAIYVTTQPVIAKLPDVPLGTCISDDSYDMAPDKGKLWWDSGAEQYAEAYINLNGDHTNWVQNLYKEMFPEATFANIACITTGSKCTFVEKCGDFNAIGKGGLYYLFLSLTNFHTYIGEMRSRFDEAISVTSLSVGSIKNDLKLDGTSPEPVNWVGMFASAFSIASTATAADPPLAAGLAVFSGVLGILSAVPLGKSPVVGEPSDLVFGQQGHKQDDIPMNMRIGGMKNPAVQVFGWGYWLRDRPNSDMNKWFESTALHMKQGLVWQMLRLFKGTYIVIRDNMNKDACISPKNAWDEEKERCYDLMSYRPDNHQFGGLAELDSIWGTYGMNQFWTMRNGVDCWEANNGNMGVSVPHSELFKYDTPPPCFFGHVVKKGRWDQRYGGFLELDRSYPGQNGDERIWPDPLVPDVFIHLVK